MAAAIFLDKDLGWPLVAGYATAGMMGHILSVLFWRLVGHLVGQAPFRVSSSTDSQVYRRCGFPTPMRERSRLCAFQPWMLVIIRTPSLLSVHPCHHPYVLANMWTSTASSPSPHHHPCVLVNVRTSSSSINNTLALSTWSIRSRCFEHAGCGSSTVQSGFS